MTTPENNHNAEHDSDPEELAFEVPLWHRQELDRRLAQIDADPENLKTWEEVKAEILRRHRLRKQS